MLAPEWDKRIRKGPGSLRNLSNSSQQSNKGSHSGALFSKELTFSILDQRNGK